MNTPENLNNTYQDLYEAHQLYKNYTQEQVDKIVAHVAAIANQNRIPLAKLACSETNMGVIEDKVIKNHFASEYVYHKYKDLKTCGIIAENTAQGIQTVADSMGIIAAIIPCTNPTSTTIFKALIALKTRNAVLFCPHPRAKRCVAETVKLLNKAAREKGAPNNILFCVSEPSVQLTKEIMSNPLTALVLATGGSDMIHSAYSSGTPSIGVGAGNTPTIIDETANLKMAVSSTILSKTFDNGVVCASEQSIIVVRKIKEELIEEFKRQGAYILSETEKQKLRNTIVTNGHLNAKIVGQSAFLIAEMAGIKVPLTTKLLIGEITDIGLSEPLSYEKLSPLLGLYVADEFTQAITIAKEILNFCGAGHTSIIYTNENNQDRINTLGAEIPTTRILVNIPGSQGAIGDIYNFYLEPSLTLGCGSYGKNSISGNITPKHLLNYKTIVKRRENMLWFRIPPKIFFKLDCLSEALHSLNEQNITKVMIITDRGIVSLDYFSDVIDALININVEYEIFAEVQPDPNITTVKKGLEQIKQFQPDAILAIGGGSPMDAAKIMWVMYDNPNIKFDELAMRFMDIRKRIFHIQSSQKKTLFVAVPTTSGTGSEISPFSVITDDKNDNIKYPIADYALTPDIAILDPIFVLNMPKSLTAASGIDAITHAIEAYVSIMATPFSNAVAKEALTLLNQYLIIAYQEGAKNVQAREKVHYAATLSGMAFSNASLGVAHSLAHKLGEAFHISHGVACGLCLPYVIQYNATQIPTKLPAFPQYETPKAIENYAEIADVLKLPGVTSAQKVDSLLQYIIDLKQKLCLPASIMSLGIDEGIFMCKVDELAERAFDDQCTPTNPRYPLISELKELLVKIYYGNTILYVNE